MSSSQPLWDPTTVLHLSHSILCIGWTDRDQHCLSKIQQAKAIRIQAITKKMRNLPPHSTEVHKLLIELAMCGLCQTHEDQHEDVIKEWRTLTRLHHRDLVEEQYASVVKVDLNRDMDRKSPKLSSSLQGAEDGQVSVAAKGIIGGANRHIVQNSMSSWPIEMFRKVALVIIAVIAFLVVLQLLGCCIRRVVTSDILEFYRFFQVVWRI